MKWTIPAVLFLASFVVVGIVSADDTYHDGYIHSGYTYRGGVWYDSYNRRYSRVRIYNPVQHYYDSYGVYRSSPQTYYYRYTLATDAYAAPAAIPITTPPVYTKDWRARADDYRMLKLDYDAYRKEWAALGFVPGSYSTPLTFNTAYGYPQHSVNSVTNLYGGLELNALMVASSRLTKNAQDAASTANSEFNLVAKTATEGHARALAILALAAGTEKVLNAGVNGAGSGASVTTSGTASVTGGSPTEGYAPSSTPGTPPAIPAGESVRGSDAESIRVASVFLKTIGLPRCGACHSGKTIRGGFNILSFPGMTPVQKEHVLDMITHDDPAKRMPRLVDGTAGRLNGREIREFAKQ